MYTLLLIQIINTVAQVAAQLHALIHSLGHLIK